MTQTKLYRHGDVLVEMIAALPKDVEKTPGVTLAYGEVTGHSHRIAESDGRIQLFRSEGELFLQVKSGATLVHDEHGPIALEPGVYRVWKQREYVDTPQGEEARFQPVFD